MLLGIWVTSACNLDCKYCYEGSDKKEWHMDARTADKIICFIEENYTSTDEPLIIQFHGGEPLLNIDLIKYFIGELKNKFTTVSRNIMFGITTNGVLLNKERIQFLANHMNYDLSISIDGDEEAHDKMRVFSNGKGTYQSIIKNIGTALQIRDDIRARLTFGTETVDHLFLSIKHLIELGFKRIVSIPDYFDRKWEESHIAIYIEQLKLIKEYYLANQLDEKDIEIPIIENNFFMKNKCTGGYSSIHVDPTGDIYPCTYVVGNPNYKIGSVYSGGINQDRLDEVDKVNDSIIIDCEGCNNYHCCISVRCRYLNEQLTTDGLCPSATICAFENANFRFQKSS